MFLYRSDAVAVSLSVLCVIHCLAFPMFAATLPLFGVLSEAEWIHKLVVTIAIPVSILSFSLTNCKSTRLLFLFFAATGFCFLIAGAFFESLERYETLLTVCGAVLLAGAHAYRWNRHLKPF